MNVGAARELFEETGLDVRKTCLDRLHPTKVVNATDEEKKTYFKLKKRLFFTLQVNDDDFYIKVRRN